MSSHSLPSRAVSAPSAVQVACAIAAILVGLVILVTYVVPNLFPDAPLPAVELVVLVAIVGLLSIAGGIGYWTGGNWGWYVHLLSVIGQLLFPGALFEFKLDLYHMIGWISPLISLLILVTMGIQMRRRKNRA